MIPLWLKALAASKAARIAAAIVGAFALLWLARCDGARHQSARDRQDAADAQAKASENAAKHDAQIGDSVKAVLADSMRDLRAAKAKADSLTAHATASIGRVTFIGPAKAPAPRGETLIGGEMAQEPDTTKYATIQRAGDARLYVVPQFGVDLTNELRRALAAKSAEADKAERNLAIAASASAKDTATIRDLRDALSKRGQAESIAKSNAGQECRLVPFVPCPPRKVVALTFTVVGAFAGYELAKR